MKKSHNTGQCPYCLSYSVDYGILELVGEQLYYPITCNDCDKTSKEWYRLEFIEVEGDEE